MNRFFITLITCMILSHACLGSIEKPISAQDYGRFLNSVAPCDLHCCYEEKMATDLACIIRNGTPGNYSYTILPGKEDQLVSFMSWQDAACYAHWSKQEHDDFSNDFAFLESDIQVDDCVSAQDMDKELKSNIVHFLRSDEALDLCDTSFKKNFSWINEMMIPFFLIGETGARPSRERTVPKESTREENLHLEEYSFPRREKEACDATLINSTFHHMNHVSSVPVHMPLEVSMDLPLDEEKEASKVGTISSPGVSERKSIAPVVSKRKDIRPSVCPLNFKSENMLLGKETNLKKVKHVSFNILEEKQAYGPEQVATYHQIKNSVLSQLSLLRDDPTLYEAIQKVIDLSHKTMEALKLAGRAVAPEELIRIKKEPGLFKKTKPVIKASFKMPLQHVVKEKVTLVDREDIFVVNSANKALQDLGEATHILQASDQDVGTALHQSQIERAYRTMLIANGKYSIASAKASPFWDKWTASLRLSEEEKTKACLALDEVQAEEKQAIQVCEECSDFWKALKKEEPLSDSSEAKKRAINDVVEMISTGFEAADHLINMLISRKIN